MNTTREVITQVVNNHLTHSVVIRTEQLIEALVSALQQRDSEVRERCMKLICEHCAAGIELDEHLDHVWPWRGEGANKARQWEPCAAVAIRRDDTWQEGDR
jgi:hypothetical protein